MSLNALNKTPNYSAIFPANIPRQQVPKGFFENYPMSTKAHEVAMKALLAISLVVGGAVTGAICLGAAVTAISVGVVLGTGVLSYSIFNIIKKATRYYDPKLRQTYTKEACLSLKTFEYLSTIDHAGIKKGILPLKHWLKKHNLTAFLYHDILPFESFKKGVLMEMDSLDLKGQVDVYRQLKQVPIKYSPEGYEGFFLEIREMVLENAKQSLKIDFPSGPINLDRMSGKEMIDFFDQVTCLQKICENLSMLSKAGLSLVLENDPYLLLKISMNHIRSSAAGYQAYCIYSGHQRESQKSKDEFYKNEVYREWETLVSNKQAELYDSISILNERYDKEKEAIEQKYLPYELGLAGVTHAEQTLESIRGRKEKELKAADQKYARDVHDFFHVVINMGVQALDEEISEKQKIFDKHEQEHKKLLLASIIKIVGY